MAAKAKAKSYEHLIAQHIPTGRTQYPWGTESPKGRIARLEKILASPEKMSGRGLRHDEARDLLAQVEQYKSERSKHRRPARPVKRSTVCTRTVLIYRLIDPVTGRVRYIGKTCRTLAQRLRGHISASHKMLTHSQRWIQSLLKQDLEPIIEPIECVVPGDDWSEAERRWIQYYRSIGCALTNITDGGEGTSGMTHSPETRTRLSETTRAYMNRLEVKERRSFELSKLDKSDIRDILNRVIAGDFQSTIADGYGMPQSYVSRIVTGSTFAHLSEFQALRALAQSVTFANSRKLTRQAVIQIVIDYVSANGTKSYADVGQLYGVGYSTVSEIIQKKIWKGCVPDQLLLEARQIAKNLARHQPSPARRLTDEQALDVLTRHESGDAIRKLARDFNVDRKAISNLVCGLTYRHLFAPATLPPPSELELAL